MGGFESDEKGNTFTVGQHPIPDGKECDLCEKPAKGSISTETERYYLCIEHLRELYQEGTTARVIQDTQ